MEERHGVKGTVTDGIFFTEQIIVGSHLVRQLRVEISRQNSNLIEVKRKLVTEAKACGATAISNFRYGQRKHDWWEYVLTFKWDTESWYGEGDAVVV